MDYTEKEIIQNMIDAGCSEACIQEFLKQYHGGCEKKCDKLLQTHRHELLDKLHQEQKRIDCLDYLMYQIKKCADKDAEKDPK